MHVSVWTPKGGVGKTMVALTLAGAFAAEGRRVLLVDHDPQGGALAWAGLARRAGLMTAFTVAPAESRGFDLVVHDHPPTLPDAGLPGAVVVMPLLLDAANYLLFRRGFEFAKERGKRVVALPNRVRTDRSEQRTLLAKAFPDLPMLRDRAIHATVYGRGQTIFSDGCALPYTHHARHEFQAFIDTLRISS